jgi:hypothetical protein
LVKMPMREMNLVMTLPKMERMLSISKSKRKKKRRSNFLPSKRLPLRP